MQKQKVLKALNELTEFRSASQSLFKAHSGLISSIIEFHDSLVNKKDCTDEDVKILEAFEPVIKALRLSVDSLQEYNESMDKDYIPAMKSLFEMAKVGKNEE
ncbi:MAG: hypothetical protein NQ098_16740 [Enterobacter cloacae]|nr:hypothetical protein [Enterobacter cloacae]